MAEKRRHPRYSVSGLDIRARTIFNTEAEILDIGGSGASLRCQRRLTMGSEYTFKFEHKDRVLSIKGVIVWATLTGSKKSDAGEVIPIYTTGIEFRETLTDETQQELRAFVADTIEELRERSLSGIRVQIYAHEEVLLAHPEMCAVKDISLGGMRIETEQNIPAGTLFFLELILREHEEPVHCRGKVAYSLELPGNEPGRYSIGVEFMDMVDDEKAWLKKFIDTFPATTAEA